MSIGDGILKSIEYVKEKKILKDVVFMRVVLIVLLVLYHSFAIFNGAWEKQADYPDIPAYWWIATSSYAFMLEAFVFISGYVFGHQIKNKGDDILSFNYLIVRKAKRLLLPGLFFSMIYYALFYNIHRPMTEIAYSILNGCGHLWFLPMLFWCFVGIYVIEKLRMRGKWQFAVIVLCSICSFLPLPLRMNNALYYFLFFYIGYRCPDYKAIIAPYIRPKYAVAATCLFVGSFAVLTCFNKMGGVNNILIYNSLLSKITKLSVVNVSRIIYSTNGLLMLYLMINLLLKQNILHVTPAVLRISSMCFGVYIFQQFILKYLYYYSGLTDICTPLALPWVGFIITLVISLLMSWIALKTKFGRFLIG